MPPADPSATIPPMHQAKLDDALAILSPAARVLVTTHIRPDGDALGSTAALILALRARGISAEALLLSRMPGKYAFCYEQAQVNWHVADPDWPAALDLGRYDVVAVVDTGTWSQLPMLKDKLAAYAGKTIVIDHHLTQEDWGDLRVVDTAAAAACELMAELIERWNIPLSPAIATSLFLGLTTDTGWFAFSNTRPATLRLAAKLMDAGVDADRMYQRLFYSEKAKRLVLQARIMNNLQLVSDQRVAVMTARPDDFAATGGSVLDTEGVINWPLQIAEVEVSLLFTQTPQPEGAKPEPIKVSLRSKGTVDVSQIAQQFGGGGHARAAGCRFEGPLDIAIERVIDAIARAAATPVAQ